MNSNGVRAGNSLHNYITQSFSVPSLNGTLQHNWLQQHRNYRIRRSKSVMA